MATKPKVATCPAHPDQEVTGNCVGCGKALCRECAKQFGFYCSQACLEKARRGISEESRKRQRETEAALRRTARLGRLIVWGIGGLVALVVCWLAWRLFLDPAGKLNWQWRPPAGTTSTRILACDTSGVTVLAGNTVVVLDPLKGREVRTFTVPAATAPAATDEDDDVDPDVYGDRGIQLLGDGSVLQELGNGLRRIGTDGNARFTRTHEGGSLQHLTLSPDQNRAFYLVTLPADLAAASRARDQLKQIEAEIAKAYGGAEPLDYDERTEPEAVKALRRQAQVAYEVMAQTRTGLVCLDLQSGEEVWASPKMKQGTSVQGLAAGAQALYAVFTMAPTSSEDEEDASSSLLFALNPADGKRLWQAALEGSPNWGPVAAGDLVLVQSGGEISAFGAAGAPAYSIPVEEESYSQPMLRDGLLWLVGETGCRCFDAATGKDKWGVLLATREDGILVCKERVYIAGQIEETLAEKDVKMPAAYKQLEKMPEVKGLVDQARKKTVQVLLALERETGAEIWRATNTYGTPLADGKRLVLVADTAQTSLLEMATGGKGTTIVSQLRLRSGKQLYARQSDLGFMEPHLAGKRVVGLTYERKERPSVFNPGATEDADWNLEPQGVAAYRVK